MSTRLVASLVSVLLAAGIPVPWSGSLAVADDKPKGEEEGTEALVTRLFDVSALTKARLFGGEAEEPTYTVGQVGDLLVTTRLRRAGR